MLLAVRLLPVLFLAAVSFAQTVSAPITTSAAPSGAAGGILAGTYPNPTLDPAGQIPAWHKYTVTKIANGVSGCANSAVGAVQADIGNMGLWDATSGGTYTGTSVTGDTFSIEVDATGTPDTFKWKKNAGSYTTGVAMTGAAQTLSDGVTVTWAATTGHTVGDKGTILATAPGCWQVDSGTPVNADAALTQSVVLFQLPALGFVSGARIKTATACTGATTITSTLGTTATADFYLANLYNLKTAVSATNLTSEVLAAQGSDTAAATNVVAGLIATVENVDQIATGCSFAVSVLYGILP